MDVGDGALWSFTIWIRRRGTSEGGQDGVVSKKGEKITASSDTRGQEDGHQGNKVGEALIEMSGSMESIATWARAIYFQGRLEGGECVK